MKVLKKIGIILLIVIITGYCYVAWSLSNLVLFPESSLEKTKMDIEEYWNTTFEKKMALMPDYEEFTVTTFDNLTLKGKYFQNADSSKCTVIFAHGWGETWAGMLKYVPAFEDCHCDYIFYDHRVHGESDGKYATGSIHESTDLLTVTDWVLENLPFNRDQIIWMGSSWGGATSILAGAKSEDISLIIIDAPFQDWDSAVFERAIKDYGAAIELITGAVMKTVGMRAGVDPSEASPLKYVDKVKEPILLIHSKADSATSISQSINISKKLNKNSKYYFTEWGNDHVMDVINNESEFRNMVTDFIREKKPEFLKENAIVESIE